MMSLQRRRQRYLLIHTWKTYRELVPNSADMIFQTNPRLGVRAILPFYQYRAEAKRASQLHNSFGSRAARTWNNLPISVNSCETLGEFKTELGKFLNTFHDCPPTRGYPLLQNTLSPACLLESQAGVEVAFMFTVDPLWEDLLLYKPFICKPCKPRRL